jgi:hypothetical protein
MTASRWLVVWRKENDFPDEEEWLCGDCEEVTVALGNSVAFSFTDDYGPVDRLVAPLPGSSAG